MLPLHLDEFYIEGIPGTPNLMKIELSEQISPLYTMEFMKEKQFYI
jgi:hypothetical protein